MRAGIYLRLGRVSNLPTVWTNCLAGLMLARGSADAAGLLPLLLALSSFYVGGMFLNDAFDYQFDRKFRPERPIPAGKISRREVWVVGFGMLILGEALLSVAATLEPRSAGAQTLILGLLLALLIVYYNYSHKRSSLSPLVMALCRALIYLIAASLAAPLLISQVPVGATMLIGYLAGLTYLAKQENFAEIGNLWPLVFLSAPFIYTSPLLLQLNSFTLIYLIFMGWVIYSLSFLRGTKRSIPRAVINLIAGISLLDAVLIGTTQAGAEWGWLAVGGFVLTLLLQRFISGT